MSDLPKDLHSTNHPKIGEVTITQGFEHVTYLRTVVDEGDIYACTERGDNIDNTVTLDLEDAEKVLRTNNPTELPNVKPVENTTQIYSCNFCGKEGESVLRYKSINGMFPISFHYDCLKHFAKEAVELIKGNTDRLVAAHI